jgi:hypothetical protein
MICPKCGVDEFEIRTIYADHMGDTDVGTCYACNYEVSEGDAEWDDVLTDSSMRAGEQGILQGYIR